MLESIYWCKDIIIVCFLEEVVVTEDINKENNHEEYDEKFKLRAVALTFARSRSLKEVAAALSIPAELLAAWKNDYADKVKVRYIKDERPGDKLFKRTNPMERCDSCGAKVVWEPVKIFEIQREEGVSIGTHDSIMNSGDDGIFGAKVPYVRVTTERIERCPACGVYVIFNLIEKLTKSEA